MSFWRSIHLVARREVRERTRTRAFLISTALMMAGIIGIVVVAAVSAGDGTEEVTVAASGPLGEAVLERAGEAGESLDLQIVGSDAASLADAEREMREGGLDAAVGPADAGPGRGALLIAEEAPNRLGPLLEGVMASVSLEHGLTRAGLPGEEARALLGASQPELRQVTDDETDDTASGIAFIATILLYVAILMAGYAVSSGVVEEKSSRVVELLLNTVSSRELLAGKVIGIGLVGLAQFTAVAASGLAAALLSGQVDLPAATVPTLIFTILYFILGYVFYGCAFAVAGSIVSRQEDSQTTTAPLMMLLVGSYLLSISAIEEPSSSLAEVSSYVPPLAPMVVPARMANDALPAEQLLLSLAAMIAGCALLIWAAGRIYDRAVLRMGAPLKLRETFSLLRR